MTSKMYLADPKTAPALNIPPSNSTVDVRIIDSTSHIDGALSIFLTPSIPGNDRLNCPAYSFLITHTSSSTSTTTHTLFDLGVRRDYENLPPSIASKVSGPDAPFSVSVKHNVAEILDSDTSDLGVKSKDIDAVIWSHHHWDHTGDVTLFPASTKLIVGPGFKKQYTPGYPAKQDSPLLQADLESRDVFREIDIAGEGRGLMIGRCEAFDYFGDGSFFLLHTPGHAVGHMCGLARVTTDPESFILMGGDACHHGGEMRPTAYLPLPKEIAPWPNSNAKYLRHGACPGELLQKIHRTGSATEPFYEVKEGFSHDGDQAEESIGKLTEFDAAENIFVVLAHDATLMEHLAFYPERSNDWLKKDLASKTRWLFAGYFEKAVGEVAS